MIREFQRCGVWIPTDGLAVAGRELESTQVKVGGKGSENNDAVRAMSVQCHRIATGPRRVKVRVTGHISVSHQTFTP